MILAKEKVIELELLSRPLIEWMNKNLHPHTQIVVDCTSAELFEGVCAFKTNDYVDVGAESSPNPEDDLAFLRAFYKSADVCLDEATWNFIKERAKKNISA